jgi:hypothetical protein
MRELVMLFGFIIGGVFLGAQALRAEQAGDTSGPAAGTAVRPPTVVEKNNPYVTAPNPEISGPSGTSAGAPGIESERGTQGGKAWKPPAEIRGKLGSS